MTREISNVSGSHSAAVCTVTESGVVEREYLYDDYLGREVEIVRYAKRRQLNAEEAMLLVDHAAGTGLCAEDLSWILPIASASAAVYLSIVEVPKLISAIRRKLEGRDPD